MGLLYLVMITEMWQLAKLEIFLKEFSIVKNVPSLLVRLIGYKARRD